MAFPPGVGGDIPDGDRKRLMQRADTFSIGTGTREAKDRDDAQDFSDALEDVSSPKKTQALDEDLEKQAKETEDYRKEQLLEQAEHRNLRTLTSLNAFPGLLTVPGLELSGLLATSDPTKSKKRSASVEPNGDKVAPTVSAPILQDLRQAGLSDPVESLDDPRLTRMPERLQTHFTLSLKGHDRVHTWKGDHCHQILRIGLHETEVESASGSTVETLKRIGQVDEKTISSKTEPVELSFPDLP